MLTRMDVEARSGATPAASPSAAELARAVRLGEVSAEEVVAAALERAHAAQERTNAFVTIADAPALAAARRLDERRGAGEEVGPLAGVPLVVKDSLATKGLLTTAGSRLLAGFVPPYDATVVARLVRSGAVVVAKSNLDEFGMGSGSENSAFGAVRNPLDEGRVAGGSSGGSAAAVAAGVAPLALGSDTGGSVRLPAAYCGLYGFKPSYGALSRNGLVAYASSLDQVGLIANDLEGVELAFELASGVDDLDATTVEPDDARTDAPLRVGLVRELSGEGFGEEALAAVRSAADRLEAAGARLTELTLPSVVHAPACYYVTATAEASSNLARFDGTLYGARVQRGSEEQEAVMSATRGALFGAEVKRRLLFGALALSAENYDRYYGKALKVRRLIADELERAFGEVDLLLTPTAAGVAPQLEEGAPFSARFEVDALHTDMALTLGNLAGLPALSVPFGAGESGMPLGVQLLAAPRADRRLLAAAKLLA